MQAYLFPGQGAQRKGMGRELFQMFRSLTHQADAILGYSIEELCLDNPDGKLYTTQYTQPALYVVNAFSFLRESEESNIQPDFLAGHSLGEFNALFAAGAFAFETGLQLVKKRGELMAKTRGGGMAAVIGLSEEHLRTTLQKNCWISIDIANYNTPTQVVISGPLSDIEHAQHDFEAEGARYVHLSVSAAFHSRYMVDAQREFSDYLSQFSFSTLKIPVIANVNARPYQSGQIVHTMADQIILPVQWTETIRYLWGLGVQEFREIGGTRILTKLVASIQQETGPIIVKE